MNQQDMSLLDHVAECIGLIRTYTEGSKDRFMASRLVQDAVMRNLQTLAESTTRLSDESKATEPDIRWDLIRDFRNVLTHGYLRIDLELVWDAVELLPELNAAVCRMREVGGPFEPPRKDRSTGGGGMGSMIANHQRTVLSDKDRALFFAALDAPAEPTAALREAVAMHRRLIRDVR